MAWRENKRIHKTAVQIALALFLVAAFGALETTRAQNVSGIVVDANNQAIVNAQVSLLNGETTLATTTTNNAGEFNFGENITANSRLRVTAAGFSTYIQNLSIPFATPLRVVLTPLDVSATVTVTGSETRLAETPASVVALSRKSLDETPAQTVDDQLRQVPGFALFRRTSSRTANPTAQGANLRGIGASGASRVAVLFDGVSVNDPFGGWTRWNQIPRQAIQGIEVLRGASSSVYGTGALAGAVNILSRNDGTPILRVETSLGTQTTADGSLFASYGKNGWTGSVAAESFQTKGFIPIAEAERGAIDRRANSRHNNGFITLERRFGENARIYGRGNIFAERRDNGTSLQYNRTYLKQIVVGGDYNNYPFGSFIFRGSLETQVYDQTFSAIGANRASETLTRVQRVPSQATVASLVWSRVFAEAHTITAGVDGREVRGASDEIVFVNGRATSLIGAGGREFLFGFSAQDFWRVNTKLNLNFGARIDRWRELDGNTAARPLNVNTETVVTYPNRTETAFSPRIAGVYQVTDDLGITAAFTTGFRAASLNELYRQFRVGNVLTLANADLRAERVANGEIGFRYAVFPNKLNFRAVAFLAEISNPITNATVSITPNLITRQRQNVGRTRSRGFEFDAEYNPLRNLDVTTGYLYVDASFVKADDEPTLLGKRLPQIPRHQFTVQTAYRPSSKLLTSIQTRFAAEQFDDDQNVFRLGSAFTVDALGSYRATRNVEVFVAAENLFDSRFDTGRTPAGTVAPGRFVRIGVRFNLNGR